MNIGKAFLKEDEFIILWSSIESELYKLFYNNTCSALVVYNNVYIICTDPGNKFIENLYWKLGDFIYERAREMRTIIYRAEDWIVEYNNGWRRYNEYIALLNELCDFMNQYMAAKSLNEFAFILWERCILQTTKKYKGTTLGKYLAFECKLEHVKEALDSLRSIVIDGRDPLLYYTQRYEQYALEKIKRKYDEEVKLFKTRECILEYSEYVFKAVEKEREHGTKTLLEESYEKLEMILQDILVTQRKKYIQSEIYKLLNCHKLPVEVLDTIRDSGSVHKKGEAPLLHTVHPINDFYALYSKKNPGKTYTFSSEALEKISKVFKNFKTIPHSYEMMKGVLVKFITTQLETHSHLLDRRIETLYLFYCMFKNVVEVGFESDFGCMEVFETKFSHVLNKLKPSLSSRLIEFSSEIVSNDHLVFNFLEDKKVVEKLKECKIEFKKRNRSVECLRGFKEVIPSVSKTCFHKEIKKQTKSSIDYSDSSTEKTNYREGALFRVFLHLFSLVENKVDFAERYAYELGKRLVEGTTDIKKETRLIQIMKGGFYRLEHGTCDSIRKAEVMLSDIKTYTGVSQPNSPCSPNSILLLTQCAWPLEYVNLNVKLPDEFLKLAQDEEKKNKKKRLYWLWEYSTVYLEMNSIEIRVNLLQFLVLNLFNSFDSLSKEEISSKTNLIGKNLEWVLMSLFRSDILSIEGNTVSLSSRPHKHNPYDYYIKENLFNVHEVNKLVYYQSSISKLMKKYKEMKFATLFAKMVSDHTNRFELDNEEIKKALNGLVEKGIVEEFGEVLRYVP